MLEIVLIIAVAAACSGALFSALEVRSLRLKIADETRRRKGAVETLNNTDIAMQSKLYACESKAYELEAQLGEHQARLVELEAQNKHRGGYNLKVDELAKEFARIQRKINPE